MSARLESIFSLGSQMAYRHSDEIFYDVMTNEELQETLETLMQRNWILSIENDIYERYLTRLNPSGLKLLLKILEKAKHTQKLSSHFAPRTSRVSFRASLISLQDVGRPSAGSICSTTSLHSLKTPSLLTTGTLADSSKISYSHRMIMARREIQEMRMNLNMFQDSVRKEIENIRAETEELEIRIRETIEAQYQFEENVVNKGIDSITGKISAEKVIRFVEEWLKTADTIVERLRLKRTTLQTQIKKSRQQLLQREELGEALRAVDFEQLNIENKDYANQIEEKTHFVLEMKKIAGYYSLHLTQHKQKLNNLLVALNAVKAEISMNQQNIDKSNFENNVVVIDLEKTNQHLDNLLSLMDNYKAPDILDFVKLEAEFKELKKTFKVLSRRKKIEEIMFKSKKTKLNKRNSVQTSL